VPEKPLDPLEMRENAVNIRLAGGFVNAE